MHKCRSYRLATTNTRKGTLVCQSEAALPKCVWNQRVGRGYCAALPAVMARLGLKGEAYNWRKLGYFGGQAPLKPLEPGLLRIELTPRPPKKTYGILGMSFECQLTPQTNSGVLLGAVDEIQLSLYFRPFYVPYEQMNPTVLLMFIPLGVYTQIKWVGNQGSQGV